ncbi:MAG: flagellar brake protein [Ectothiorhodospiraceae bacterium]|nr:flagellar brake protein [Ectothiorhodospiraceae bacterium]
MAASELVLEVGDNLQLQFEGDDETRHYVKVIGYLSGRSLVVSTPVVDGHALLVSEGKSVVVRLMSGNAIVGFSVKVIVVSTRPYPHLHLSFPADVQAVTVRKALRVNLNMKASVLACLTDSSEIDTSQAAQDVTLQDMSTSGALLIAQKPLAKEGQRIAVSVRFDVADAVEEISLLAIVRNIRTERGEKVGQRYFHHGVELRLQDRAQSILVHAFVYQCIARGQTD